MDISSTPVSWYKGIASYYSGLKNIALTEFENALKVHPNHIRVLNDLAGSYEQSGNYDKAIYYYKKTLSITPNFTEGKLNISVAYFNAGKIDSSFYFIDKLYGQYQDYRERENYNKYLDVILSEYAYNLLNIPGIINPGIDSLIADKKYLRQIYDNSKTDNIPFAKKLKEFNY
jgi:tetratricopeptide (TPR) repeat protein